jgi:trigger factor
MQVTETLVEGLKREFKVVVPASELDSRLVERLSALKDEVRIKGFRPGKVPISHLRRLFGRTALAEIVQSVQSEVARDTLADRGEKAATPPDYRMPEGDTATDQLLAGKADLAYTMAYEVLPKIELTDFKTISIERPVIAIGDDEVEARLSDLAAGTRAFTTKEGKAEAGDRLSVAYVGTIDGEAFEGGSDDNAVITIGDDAFIAGFADQLVGLSTGDRKSVTVTFPADYATADLAGKTATFDVTVKAVTTAEDVAIDDNLATRLGLDSVDALRQTVRQQLQSELDMAARQKIKRQLLDRLDTAHKLDLPPGMVDQEFESIWRQVTAELSSSGKTFEGEGTTEETVRAEYRQIAERRVRLGLVMAEIGERNRIEVTEEEVQRALAAQMRQFPGREQALIDYYRENPDAVAGLRAPIFEEKVVDYLLELVEVTDKPVTREELLREDDETPPG